MKIHRISATIRSKSSGGRVGLRVRSESDRKRWQANFYRIPIGIWVQSDHTLLESDRDPMMPILLEFSDWVIISIAVDAKKIDHQSAVDVALRTVAHKFVAHEINSHLCIIISFNEISLSATITVHLIT